MILETQRLLLRPWELTDAERLYDMAKDPEIGLNAGWPPHTDVENSRTVIREVFQSEGIFAVILKETGLLIGCAGWIETTAHEDLHELELGYWLGRAYWGHGYMTEIVRTLQEHIFTVLDQPRLWVAHYEGNRRSQRVIEKCGFSPMFRREEYVEALQERRICCYYALERADFKKKGRFPHE